MNKFRKRPRLNGFRYKGCHRYFVTICTHQKSLIFTDKDIVALCKTVLEKKSQDMRFTVWAYCFMPDHLHLLLEGSTLDADLKKFVTSFKQVSGYRYSRNVAQNQSPQGISKLWQPSFYDHVLRKEEDLVAVARYILNNPVRKGLAEHYREYPFSGSFAMRDGLKALLSFPG